MTGRHREARDFWLRLGVTYQAAWASAGQHRTSSTSARRARMFDRLGARGAGRPLRREAALHRRQGPARRAGRRTRANIGGLTDREVEVLELLDEGLRNAEIAARLHLSEKTVGPPRVGDPGQARRLVTDRGSAPRA